MRILSVKYINGYLLEITFSNKVVKRVDLSKFLKTETNPMTTAFRNKKLFKKVYVEYGHLTWLAGENELNLSAEGLYNWEKQKFNYKISFEEMARFGIAGLAKQSPITLEQARKQVKEVRERSQSKNKRKR
jgi:hypothetical protein